jgi:hypothetical protein
MPRETKAAETYAALTALTAKGTRLADAVRQLAADSGRSESAIRAAYYAQRVKLGHHGRTARTATVDDALHEARRLIEQALAQLDAELANAKHDLDTATGRYEAARVAADAQRTRLQQTLTALNQH